MADERKTFIDNLAHEMKTPLTSILGFADILRIKRVVTDKERQDYASVIVERFRAACPNAPISVLRDGRELPYEAVLTT